MQIFGLLIVPVLLGYKPELPGSSHPGRAQPLGAALLCLSLPCPAQAPLVPLSWQLWAAALPFALLPQLWLCKWLWKQHKLQQEEIIARLWWEKDIIPPRQRAWPLAGRAGGELCCRMIADKMPGPAPMASGDGSAAL